MLTSTVKKYLIRTQVWLSMWLTRLCTDCYDAMRYESQIHQLLNKLNIDYQSYATVPGFDYCNPSSKTWTIFLLQEGEWNLVQLPNPFHKSNNLTLPDREATANFQVDIDSELNDVDGNAGVHSALHA